MVPEYPRLPTRRGAAATWDPDDRCNVSSSHTHISVMTMAADEGARRMGDVSPDPSFAEFVAAHERILLRFAYLITGNQADAEDAVQDALIKTARRWATIHPEGAPAYVRRVVTNQAIENKRRRRDIPVDLDADAAVSVDGGLLRYEADQAFFGRLRLLPPKQRAAVVLRYYLDLSDAEVGACLGCTPQTVRSQIHRALDRLRRSMDADPTESDDEA